MAKLIVIKSSNIESAISIIGNYLHEYEKPYEFGSDSKEWQRNKRDYQSRLIAGLEVLSAVTGDEYRWTRIGTKNGKPYSVICRTENGEIVEICDSYMGGVALE